MTLLPLMAFAAMIALQPAPGNDGTAGDSAAAAPVSFDEIPITQATAPRCGVAFAVAQGLQDAGDERASDWPDLKAAGGQEFFVRAMANLMDARALDRPAVVTLVEAEVARHRADDYAQLSQMMPGCLLLLEASPDLRGEGS